MDKYIARLDNSKLYRIIVEVETRKEIFKCINDKNVVNTIIDQLEKGTFNLDNVQVPVPKTMLLVFHEKHNDRTFIYNSVEEFYKIFLMIFLERYRESWCDDEPYMVEAVGMTIEQIEELPSESVRRKLLQQYREHWEYLKAQAEYDEVQKHLEYIYDKEDSVAAFKFLAKRNAKRYDYERYEIKEPEKVIIIKN